ncbi:MAG TPA: T9SS type A sorting domain-containing protein, partial [Rhodothermales bacterium]|nr:T9SS type A sorting domain-containing protein [Rhodothermales bacterium]
CLIIDIQITENVDAGGAVSITIVVQEDVADVNAARGVQMVLVPDDWTFVSGTFDANDINGAVGAGALEENSDWADSAAVGVYPAPDGMKWVGLISDAAFAHGDTLLMETTVEFTAGGTGGTFPVGIVVTKESYHPTKGDWFATGGSNIVGADSAMVNYVTVNAGSGGITTIRELIRVPDENIQALIAAGQGLTQDVMDSLLTAHLDRENEYTIRGVVLTDPLNSGLATWNADRGGPDRVHIYIRDPAADDMGNEAMGIQLVDGAYEQNGTLDLIPGDVIEITGLLTPFANSMQFSPTTTIVVLGHYTDLGLSDNIIVPDTFTTADFNQGFGDGTYQANWANYNALNGSLVCVDNTTLFRRTVTGSREDWALTSDGGETAVTTYDMSIRYRNDRRNAYLAPFNVRANNFVPPPIGASLRVCGTVVHQPGNDPYGLATPGDGMLSLVPWSDADLLVKESPPQVGALNRPETFLTSADAFEVVSDVTFDPLRAAVAVTLTYEIGGGSVDVAMVNTEGTTWTGTIPAQAEGTFVTYSIAAEDNTGAVTESSRQTYRVLDADGINTIAEIQETADGGPGASPFRNASGALDITAIVQSDPAVSGFISIQDDSTLAPWSGIIVTATEALLADLATGDEIHITSGTIVEQFDVTELRDIEYEKTAGTTADQLPYKEVDTALLASSGQAEAHEGMLIQFNDVLVLANLSFGEWRYTNGTADEAVLGDGASASFPDDNSLFQPGEKYAYMRGIWWFSFGTYKLVPEDAEDVGELTNTAVEPTGVGVPAQFSLRQNYPNPFNPTTTIQFDVATPGLVRLDVFDVTGRLVTTLVNETLSAGSYQTAFDAGNLPSGAYLYRMTAGDQVMTNKMLLLR